MKKFFILIAAMTLLTMPSAQADFIRGDADGDGDVDLADLALLEQATGFAIMGGGGIPHYAIRSFNGFPPADLSQLGCPDKADVNDDGIINSRDVSYLYLFLNSSGPAPRQPFPFAGADPNKDGFACGECFVAGNTATTGWVRRIYANRYNPTDDLHLTVELIANNASIKDLQELSVVDYKTLVGVSKPSGRAQTNYIGIGGAISAPIHLGNALMSPPALGVSPNAITIDASGNFVIAEEIDVPNGINTAQYAVMNPMSLQPLETFPVGLTSHHPRAVRFDERDPGTTADDALIALENTSNERAAKVVQINPDHSAVMLCEESGSLFRGNDLTIDRESGQYYYSMLNSDGGAYEQVRRCYQTGPSSWATGVVLFENDVTAGGSPTPSTHNLLALDQMPALSEHLVVIALKGSGLTLSNRLFRVTNDGSYDVVAGFELDLGVTGVTDVICVPDK